MKKFALLAFKTTLILVLGFSSMTETNIINTEGAAIGPRGSIPTVLIKPMAHALKRITCSIDNDIVSVRSIIEQTDKIIIYDRDYGFVHHHTFDDNLYHQINISMSRYAENFIILIKTENSTYQGEFEIITFQG